MNVFENNLALLYSTTSRCTISNKHLRYLQVQDNRSNASSQAKGSNSTLFLTNVRNKVELEPLACEDGSNGYGMGVLHLWEILSPVGETGLQISELSGKVLAVDLSMWILEFRKSVGTAHLHNLYLRNLFYRTLEFMKEGVHLLFVLDGLAPDLKHGKLKKDRDKMDVKIINSDQGSSRPVLEMYSAECVTLIECLGIPWIKSPGEAEEMCAYLNQKGVVDGCITKDSDFFCYGGQTIYRNLRKESKLYVVDLFEAHKIQTQLRFTRRDLVAIALMLGCDYNSGGVKNVGRDKAVALLKYWRESGLDSIERILGWYENEELDKVEQISKSRSHKDQHCKKCNHTGRTKNHVKDGCVQCKTEVECIESCDIFCYCDWHREDKLIQQNKLEITARLRSRETDQFIQTSKKVVEEYMKPDLGIDVKKEDIVRQPINLKALVDFLNIKLFMSEAKVLEVITPVFVLSQLFQKHQDYMYTPIRIERSCKFCGIEGFLVSWDKTDRNKWSMPNSVEVKVEKKLFTDKFPCLARQFEERQSKKPPPPGKRKQSSTVELHTPKKKEKKTTKHKPISPRQRSIGQFFSPVISTHLSQSLQESPSEQDSQSVHQSPSVHQSQSAQDSTSVHQSPSVHQSASAQDSTSVHQ